MQKFFNVKAGSVYTYTVVPVYNIGLYDTSYTASDILWY
jgi:hypothetical protein